MAHITVTKNKSGIVNIQSEQINAVGYDYRKAKQPGSIAKCIILDSHQDKVQIEHHQNFHSHIVNVEATVSTGQYGPQYYKVTNGIEKVAVKTR